jgi:exonuclease III
MNMKLLSWNIQSGGGQRCSSIIDSISQYKADLVVISEFQKGDAGSRIAGALNDLGLKNQTAALNALHGKNSVLIASRFNGNEKPDLNIPEVLKSHVTAAMIEGILVIGVFCATPDIGNLFIEFLCDPEYKFHDENVLVTGDFYFGPQGSNPKNYNKLQPLLKSDWVDVWMRDNPQKEQWCHFSSRGGKSRPDHIFVTDKMSHLVKDAYYSDVELNAGFSDHAPMIATINS